MMIKNKLKFRQRTFLFVFIMMFSSFVFSQSDADDGFPFWVNITSKGGFVNSHLFCNNIGNDMDVDFGYFNPGYTVGGQVGLNWGGGFGGAVEIMYTGITQKYDIKHSPGNYTKDIKIGMLDKALLLKSVGIKGSYLEIGTKFTKILSYSEENSIQVPYKNKREYYSDNERVGILFGFGINIFFTDIYSMNIGSRVAYTISDFMDGEHYPINDGIHDVNSYATYSTTNLFTVDLVLSLNFQIGNLDKKDVSFDDLD